MRVVMYKADDGSVWSNQAECNRRNGELRIAESVRNALKANKIKSEDTDERGNSVVYTSDEVSLSIFLSENREVLLEILNNSIVVKRGRKPRSEQTIQPGSYA